MKRLLQNNKSSTAINLIFLMYKCIVQKALYTQDFTTLPLHIFNTFINAFIMKYYLHLYSQFFN